MSSTLQQQANKELAYRELEARHEKERNSLKEFIKSYWKLERKIDLIDNRHIDLICYKLEQVFYWNIKRLIINVPPRSLKTETVSIAFPAWWIGKDHKKKFMAISYSASLAEKNSWAAREIYTSNTYKSYFPRTPSIKEDQNTKQHRANEEWWQYYSAGSTGTIRWVGADIILIDDPLNSEESSVVRQSVNNNYFDVITSRLDEPDKWAIVIIMQRLHDDDLCWHLIEKMNDWTGDKWDIVSIPAIAETDNEYRKAWESFFEKRFPIEWLLKTKTEAPQRFASQYQQNPIDKESQEFHEEHFRYYTQEKPVPTWWRIFTTCDPAFKKWQDNDNSCVMTGKFIDDKLYILDYSVWKYDPGELIDKLVYHIKKRSPEKVGIEAFQAQSMIWFNLNRELESKWLHVSIEEIKQTGDKLAKIRKLVPLYQKWLIYHNSTMVELEAELKRFPKWRHDDIIDAEQMLYDLYTLQPNSWAIINDTLVMKYDRYWNPLDISYGDNEWL